MKTPSTCLSLHSLGDARKAFDAKVAEVKKIDESNARDAHITAASIMLNELSLERNAIVKAIQAQAQSEGFSVDWGRLVVDTGTPVQIEEGNHEVPTASKQDEKKQKLKNYSWDRVALSNNYNNEQLNELMRQVEEEHANERKDGRYYENGSPTLSLYDKEGLRKLDNLSWAITHNLKKEKNQIENPLESPVEIPVKKTALSSVLESENTKTGEGLTNADAVITTDISTLEDHENIMEMVRNGTIQVAQFKEAFASFVENQDKVREALAAKKKDDLLMMGGAMFAYRNKSENKDSIIKSLVNSSLDEYAYINNDSITWTYGQNRLDVVAKHVTDVTQEDLVRYAEKYAQKLDEYAKGLEAQKEALENPKTLQDFNALMKSKMSPDVSFTQARLSLSLEQRIEYDRLAADSSRDKRNENKIREQHSALRAPSEGVEATDIIQTKHTKHGHDLWQFNLNNRVSGDEFKSLVSQARRLGGDYSSYRGNGAIPGWQFKTLEAAQAFKDLIAGDVTAAKEVMDARRDAFADDRSQSAVDRLNEMAQALKDDAEESLSQDRKVNTHRRAGMASRVESNARASIAIAKTMNNVANAIDSGKAQLLDRIREKKQIEMLNTAVNLAWQNQRKSKGLTWDQIEKQKGMPADVETADYAEFPSYSAYRSDLASLARQLVEVDGTKMLGKRLLEVADDVDKEYLAFAKENLYKVMTFRMSDGSLAAFSSKGAAENAAIRSGFRGQAIPFMVKRGEYTLIQSPSAAIKNGTWTGDHDKRITLNRDFAVQLVEKIGKAARKGNKVSVPWQFEATYEKQKTLSRMNVETPAEYRAALREFIALQEAPEEADKIKELERSMVGRANDDLDFFPTPEATADALIDVAEIEPGMNVLEPSAGWGHIAEKIRDAGVEPDVVELSSKRKDLLEAKGFNVVGSDFLEMKPRQLFTFGDTFRAPDGTEGILRGSGGLGSDRVRLVDDNGTHIGYYNRSDLEPVKLNGTQSGYDRIIMNPPFSDRRDAEHVQHAYSLLKPGGRLVAIMGEGVFFGKDKKAEEFRTWLESMDATDEKLEEGTFLDPSLPVNTSVSARMVVINKPEQIIQGIFRTDNQKGPIPEDKRLSVAAIIDVVDQLIKPFKTSIPTNVVDSITSIDLTGDQDGTISGATMDGQIYLFRDAIASIGEVRNTLFHELLHFGLRHYLTEEQYDKQLNHLYNTDGWLRNRADAWVKSKQAKDLLLKNKSLEHVRARGIDEGLAELSEIINAHPTGYRNNDLTSIAIRNVRKWVAKLADLFGFHEAAQVWRSTSALPEARKLVADTFEKLKEDAPISEEKASWINETAFRRNESKLESDDNLAYRANYAEPEFSEDYWLGMDLDHLQELTAQLSSTWKNKPTITVVDSVGDLPFKAIPSAKGVYRNGHVYLVAANIRSEAEAQFVLFHEVYGHTGLRGAFGDQLNGALLALASRNKEVASSAKKWRDHNQFQRTNRSEAQFMALSVEEALADMAGLGVEVSGMDRFIAALQKALRAIGLNSLAAWMENKTHADVLAMLHKAKTYVQEAKVQPSYNAVTANAYSNEDASMSISDEEALADIGSIEDAFHFKSSDKTTVEGIVADMDADIKVRKLNNIPGETRYELSLPDGRTARLIERPFNKYGRSIYGYDLDASNEMFNQIDERPGKYPEEMDGKGDVWIDVSLLKQGRGFGAKIYQIAATYAHNTDKVFIGDPAGISDEALRRRPEQMLSSALKYGTTEHLAPHPEQIRGKPSRGIGGLDWVYGDHIGNIEKLIDLCVQNIDNVGGIGGITYDERSGEFNDGAGNRIGRADLLGLAQVGLGRKAQAGGSTLARYAFLTSLLQSLRTGQSRRNPRGWLARLSRKLRDHVSTVDKNVSLDQSSKRDAKQLFYSTGNSHSLSSALTRATNNFMEVKLPAQYRVADLFERAGTVNWWHKTVGTQYNLAKRNPAFAKVFDRIQSFIGDVSMFTAEAAELAPTILPKLETLADLKKQPLTPEDAKAIAAPIFEGTLLWSRDENGNPIKLSQENEQAAGIVFEPDELRALFNLNDEQIKLYQEFRQSVDTSLTNLAITDMVKVAGKEAKHLMDQALATKDVLKAGQLLSDYFVALSENTPDAEESLLATASLIESKAQKAHDLMQRGYAPLTRFGRHTVYVEHEGEQVYFGLFESPAEAAKMARQMRVEYPDGVTVGTMSQEVHKLFAGVSPETIELFGDMLALDQAVNPEVRDAYQAYLRLAKNNRSPMKRLIHRKGVAGFSEDAGRVLASFIYSNGRLTAANRHMGDAEAAIMDIPKEQGELRDAATQLRDHVKNPQNDGQQWGGLMFAQYLGGSIASAMVNLTQPFMMTMPYLSQFGGIKQAGTQLAAAARDAYKDTTGDDALDKALKLAEEEGIVSPQEVHHIQAQAAGRGTLQSGDGTRAGNAKAKANNALEKVKLGWGKFFSLAEQTNRRITFIAAYRTAVAQHIANPAKFAAEAVEATQGIYNAGNKPKWARSTLGGLAMTFKQYSIAYVELLNRLWTAGEPGSKERKAGQRAAIYMLAVLFLMSGADGLPFEQDIEDLIDTVLQHFGYNFSTKRAKERFFTEALGEAGSDFMLKGVSGISGIPIDVAGRFGLGNLIPATGLLKSKASHTQDWLELAGAPGDFVKRSLSGAEKVLQGDVWGAAKEVAPRALSNAAKGAEMWDTGEYINTTGKKVNDVTGTEAVLKAIGFQPNSTAHMQDATMQANDLKSQHILASGAIQELWARGIAKGDPDLVQEAREKRDEWNEKNPESPIRVNMPSVIKRVRDMRLDGAQRTERHAPKALKSAVRAELDDLATR